MYQLSQYSNKIKNTVTEEVFPQDDTHVFYPSYLEWLQNNGEPTFVNFFDGEQDELLNNNYMIKLQTIVTDLRLRAKGAAIGKTGSNAYIVAQVEFYEIKFQQCSNQNNPPEVELLLQNEAAEFGKSLEDFKLLVVSMYNDAKLKYNLFMRMIERCRTKIQTLIEQKNWENVEIAFAIVETLNNADQAQEIMDEILNL